MTRIEQYDLLVNNDDEVLLAIDTQPGKPEKPQFHFEEDTLVLARAPGQILHFPEVTDFLKGKTLAKGIILIAESDDGGIVHDYSAGLRA